MRKLGRIQIALFCVLFIAFSGCEEDLYYGESNYNQQEVLDWRRDKDEAFKDASQSPLPEELLGRFTGLPYYEPDEDYAVEAVLKRDEAADTVTIRTTTDELRRAIVVGDMHFTMLGVDMSLVAYQFVGGNRDELFIPFKDATNGSTTYKGGRYITIPTSSDDGSYILDFNMAYNPYCVYNKAFSCPLVPTSNVLTVSVEAGEKK